MSKKAKSYLEEYKRLYTLALNKTAEKDRWTEIMHERATSVTAQMGGERVQSSGSKHRMADGIDSGIDRINQIERRIKELYAQMDAIVADIERLPEDKSDILYKVYVLYMSLKEVAASRGEAYSTVATNHGNALKLIENILNERETKATKSN